MKTSFPYTSMWKYRQYQDARFYFEGFCASCLRFHAWFIYQLWHWYRWHQYRYLVWYQYLFGFYSHQVDTWPTRMMRVFCLFYLVRRCIFSFQWKGYCLQWYTWLYYPSLDLCLSLGVQYREVLLRCPLVVWCYLTSSNCLNCWW